jgi:dUTP pyrophosphatase
MTTIKFKRLSEDAIQPKRQTLGSAGYDLHSKHEITIPSESQKTIYTGISMSIPKGYYGEIKSRSSFASRGFHVEAGVIDSDYTGEILVIISNRNKNELDSLHISKGDRIAQIIFKKYATFEFQECDQLEETIRGNGGFGSTGK